MTALLGAAAANRSAASLSDQWIFCVCLNSGESLVAGAMVEGRELVCVGFASFLVVLWPVACCLYPESRSPVCLHFKLFQIFPPGKIHSQVALIVRRCRRSSALLKSRKQSNLNHKFALHSLDGILSVVFQKIPLVVCFNLIYRLALSELNCTFQS